MSLLELSKVLMCQFRYDTLKINMVPFQDYYSQTLIV